MSVVMTVSIIATMGVLVALGWVVDNRGAVILPPILVDSLILTLPALLLFGIPVVGTLVLAMGLVWKYNDLSR